ncbi:ubiquitin family domain-containing protein [Ditylenchus destructor]|uniref:Ubiquitin family domain-containing protein n=1 Tax=Ditylenchus destructor TaxID=166010 RepID=A0AAD4R2D5_9BILA|nr:ubiquitin family domain-containing protein [Ditylenchus destructor]
MDVPGPRMFRCTQCTANFQCESDILRHLSVKHLRYFPYSCNHCEESDEIYPTATEDDMNEHVVRKHPGSETSFNVVKVRDTEAKLKVLIEESRLAGVNQDAMSLETAQEPVSDPVALRHGAPTRAPTRVLFSSAFWITVNLMNGQKVFNVRSDDTVVSLKEKIQATNAMRSDFYLFSEPAVRRMHDEKRLSDYKIEEGSRVHVLPGA